MAGSAPLVGTASAPVPRGAAAEWIAGGDGVRLRAALFSPPTAPRGSVVISPGRTEAIEKYFEVAARLTSRGFMVLAHDWRGQGLSDRPLPDRLLGHAVGDAAFLSDFAGILSAFEARLPGPWLALGHSMGGCLTLLALERGETRFSAAILSAPMLGLRTGAVPRVLARALAAVLTAAGHGHRATPGPAGAAPATFTTNVLTHDVGRYTRNAAQVAACPDLALGSPTWGWLEFAFSATARLARGPGVPRVRIPVTVVAAGDDALVDNQALKSVTSRLPRGRYVEISGAYHEILQETDDLQAVFWREFDNLAASVTPCS